MYQDFFTRWKFERTLTYTLVKNYFFCPQFPKAFSNGITLKHHLRIHSDKKPLPCNQCYKSFSNGGSLKEHLWTHSVEKPLPCPQCPKAFSNGVDLKQHLTHSGDKAIPLQSVP